MKEGAPDAAYGARAAVRLVARLEQRFGTRRGAQWSRFGRRAPGAPEPSELEGQARHGSGVSPAGRDRARAPLFLVEGDGGSCLDLVRRLHEQQPSYALVAPVVEGDVPQHTIDERVEASLAEVRRLAPRGPYLFGGVATGGRVALEMARRVRAFGEEVPLVLMLDTWGPNYPAPLSTTTGWQSALFELYRLVEQHVAAICLHERGRRLSYLSENAAQAITDAAAAFANRRAMSRPPRARAPRPYAGRVVLVRSTCQPLGIAYDRTMGWGEVVEGGIDVIESPGLRDAMAVDPWARILADKLSPVLASAQREIASGIDAPDSALHL